MQTEQAAARDGATMIPASGTVNVPTQIAEILWLDPRLGELLVSNSSLATVTIAQRLGVVRSEIAAFFSAIGVEKVRQLALTSPVPDSPLVEGFGMAIEAVGPYTNTCGSCGCGTNTCGTCHCPSGTNTCGSCLC